MTSGPDFPSPDLRLTFVLPFEGFLGSLLQDSAQHHLRFSFAAAHQTFATGGDTHWQSVGTSLRALHGLPSARTHAAAPVM